MTALDSEERDLLRTIAVIREYYVDEDNLLAAATLVKRGYATVESQPDMLAIRSTQAGIDAALRLKLAKVELGHIEYA